MRAFCDKHGLILFEDNCESMGASAQRQALRHVRRRQHVQHVLLPPHFDDGGWAAGDERHGNRSSCAGDPQSWMGARCAGRFRARQPARRPFFEAYRFVLPGYNVRPLEMAGAVGLEQLKKLDAMIAIRRANAALFVKLFGDDPRFIIQRENGASSWFSFTLILNPSADLDRAAVMNALRNAGIEFRMITGGCFPEHEAIKYFDYDIAGGVEQGDHRAQARLLRGQPSPRSHGRADRSAAGAEVNGRPDIRRCWSQAVRGISARFWCRRCSIAASRSPCWTISCTARTAWRRSAIGPSFRSCAATCARSTLSSDSRRTPT